MWSAGASAITVDGTVDAEYGPAVSVQMVNTQFGDALPPVALGGSELDAAYAAFDGGRLYLVFTGNHEPNFNKFDVFIDSVAGGENVLSSTPEYDFFTNGAWNSQNMGGMTLDTGFEVDYHLFSRWGGGNTTGPYEADFVNRHGGTTRDGPRLGRCDRSAGESGRRWFDTGRRHWTQHDGVGADAKLGLRHR